MFVTVIMNPKRPAGEIVTLSLMGLGGKREGRREGGGRRDDTRGSTWGREVRGKRNQTEEKEERGEGERGGREGRERGKGERGGRERRERGKGEREGREGRERGEGERGGRERGMYNWIYKVWIL